MTTLYVLVGLSGVGKSTVAKIISKETNAQIHRTDVIRKEIVSGEPTYSRDESQRVYDELFDRGKNSLQNETDVILDATFSLEIGRNRAENIAEETNSDIKFIKVTCDDSIVKERLRQRSNGSSDAGVEVYESQKDSFEPLERDHIEIDNSGMTYMLEQKVKDKIL